MTDEIAIMLTDLLHAAARPLTAAEAAAELGLDEPEDTAEVEAGLDRLTARGHLQRDDAGRYDWPAGADR